MRRAEFSRVLDWAASEGWNPGLDDVAAFWAADPEGFFVAEDDGAPVAAISVVNHSDAFAFLGLYLCLPEYRGRGIGLELWRHALAHAGGRTVGLDGVVAQQPNYERSGFVSAGATRRYTGLLDGAASSGIRNARPEEVPALVALEGAASGSSKPAYLRAWFSKTRARRTFVIALDGVPRAVATIRACREGAKIGPVVARDAGEAWALILHAAASMPGPMTVDVLAGAGHLADRCAVAGMRMGFETARMYRGAAPRAAPTGGARLFGVVSLELG